MTGDETEAETAAVLRAPPPMVSTSETAPDPSQPVAPALVSSVVRRVRWGFVVVYALAYMGTCLLFLAPLLVTLALKVSSLVGIERAPQSLSLVAGIGAFLAMVGNPFFGN
jgi:hypothetical protein